MTMKIVGAFCFFTMMERNLPYLPFALAKKLGFWSRYESEKIGKNYGIVCTADPAFEA